MDQGVSVPGVSLGDLDAVRALMPVPATVAPPAVGDANVEGAAVTYARADHTHRSSVQRGRVSVPLTAGKGPVTFVHGYTGTQDDTTLLVITEPETPDQSGYTYLSNVIPGTITATGFQVQVRKVMSSVTLPTLATALLGLVINIFSPATGSVTVKFVAAPISV